MRELTTETDLSNLVDYINFGASAELKETTIYFEFGLELKQLPNKMGNLRVIR